MGWCGKVSFEVSYSEEVLGVTVYTRSLGLTNSNLLVCWAMEAGYYQVMSEGMECGQGLQAVDFSGLSMRCVWAVCSCLPGDETVAPRLGVDMSQAAWAALSE